eukprot:8515193-Alexandrium_andersonii.AAC.1
MQHPDELAALETRGAAHRGRVPLPRDGLELLLSPLLGRANLWEVAEQERPGPVLPQAVALGPGLKVEPL